jgi:hypothetical protein
MRLIFFLRALLSFVFLSLFFGELDPVDGFVEELHSQKGLLLIFERLLL